MDVFIDTQCVLHITKTCDNLTIEISYHPRHCIACWPRLSKETGNVNSRWVSVISEISIETTPFYLQTLLYCELYDIHLSSSSHRSVCIHLNENMNFLLFFPMSVWRFFYRLGTIDIEYKYKFHMNKMENNNHTFSFTLNHTKKKLFKYNFCYIYLTNFPCFMYVNWTDNETLKHEQININDCKFEWIEKGKLWIDEPKKAKVNQKRKHWILVIATNLYLVYFGSA